MVTVLIAFQLLNSKRGVWKAEQYWSRTEIMQLSMKASASSARKLMLMEALNTTVLSPAPSCFHQKASARLTNQTSPKTPAQISLGDGLYIFGLIGVFIILKTLLTINTMLENQADESDHTAFQSKRKEQNIALVHGIAKAVQRVESSTILDVSHLPSCQTFSSSSTFVPLHEGKSSTLFLSPWTKKSQAKGAWEITSAAQTAVSPKPSSGS
ncbi:uncharacterized protein LOC115092556 [Rhinatrema bivittatum]|uniref:uncharacterized protein LOC115092556 n=1 Tax=Rhinatrema bivittatum TaxID=194408 RepID=UPI00112AF2E8|nr:uncharacterized protein LOC115092556 [Rhinatrema bivittatum]